VLKMNNIKHNSHSLSIQNESFATLLLGNDINSYSMARAFHERYGIRSTVYGKYPTSPCHNSQIIDYHACEQIDLPECFIEKVCRFAERHRDKKVLLIGCGDNYIKLCCDFKGRYLENVIAPYPGRELLYRLFHKERFYQLCEEHALPYPATFVYRREMGANFTLPFEPPYILKPSNPIMYWQYPFPAQKKVYRLGDRAALEKVLDRVYDSGYIDSMIIQEFIPGDDTCIHVMTGYSNKDGRVELMALGHVLLEEHAPRGIGNHAVIINEYDQALSCQLKDFLEAISFTGYFNFDLKYDQRDNKFKVLELNARQGRSNYYVTGSGYNLAECVVNDYLYNKQASLTIVKEKFLWSVVPKYVMFRYIRPRAYREEMKMLLEEGRFNNPLFYSPDMSLKRRLSLFKSQLGHVYKYQKYLENKKEQEWPLQVRQGGLIRTQKEDI